MSRDSAGSSKQRILEGAAAVLAEAGYRGASISMISARCELPVSSIYWHFRDKDDLVAAVMEELYEAWLETSVRPAYDELAGGSLEEDLRTFAQRLVVSLTEEPGYLAIGLMLTLELDLAESQARARSLAMREECTALLAEELAGLCERWGRPCPAEVATHAARTVVVSLDGLFFPVRAAAAVDLSLVAELLTSIVLAALDGEAPHRP